jgi:hypothetical protein
VSRVRRTRVSAVHALTTLINVADEHVFTVAGATAVPATPISLVEAGFTERSHLQEWVIAHPEILGPGVLIVTMEFERWRSASGGQERDRLDVLGLDRNGRLVVAELKRDVAPDTVEMQALKYAAMASRFTAETLAAQHAQYLSRRKKPTEESEARELLEAHSGYELVPEHLAKPRIVLLASSFPPVVTATAVWLTEMSLDITLMRFQAYRAEGQVLVTVSQLYPVRDVEEFTVAPVRSSKPATEADKLPDVPWRADDLRKLRDIASSTVLAALDLCAASPGGWIPLRQIEECAGRELAQARADLAVLTMTVKRHFGRSNWPFVVQWAAGGEQQAYYSMSADVAAIWRELARAPNEASLSYGAAGAAEGDHGP